MAKRNPRAKTIQLTQEMRDRKAWATFRNFLDTATEAEHDVIGHLKPFTFKPEDLMKEVWRLISESKKRCTVIPFPEQLARKNADFTSDRDIKIDSVIIDLQKGVQI